MVNINVGRELSWDEQMQPSDIVSHFEDDESEHGTEESFEQTAHHVVCG
jgi:hypothetical protein